jgi:hypothetical protein
MRWLVAAQPGTMDAVMLGQTQVLRDQMASVPMPGDEPPAAQGMPPGPGFTVYGRLLGRHSHFDPG